MSSRDLIVVDLETGGLHDGAVILEVAAVNVSTGKTLTFVPHVSREKVAAASPEALQVNRYYERGVWRNALHSQEATRPYWNDLRTLLDGNTFAGSNPTFDSRLLARVVPVSWHHRLADLAAYAAGKLHIDPTELPGLAAVCELLDVENTAPHTALGDALAAAGCFRKLAAMRRRL